MQEEDDARIRRLAGESGDRIGPSCPTPGEWASLAAGIAPPNRREELLAHATECDACGSLLRDLVEDFTAERTEQEQSEIASLPTATPEGQEDLAKRMEKASSGKRAPSWMWMGKAAVVVLGVAASWFGYGTWRAASSPARLLAVAYNEQRPFDYRVEGGAPGAIRLTRSASSSFDRPAALQEAELKIVARLSANPNDPEALALRGRAEMLAWNPDEAVAALTRALDQRKQDPRLMAELGIAYALRAEASQRAVDYNYAIEHLERALQANPTDVHATFNRAIIYERLFLYDKAIEEWRRYLTHEKDAGWAEEARARLQQIEQKKTKDVKP